MNNLWRNREFRRYFGAAVLVAAIVVPLCFREGRLAGWLALALAAVLLTLSWGFTRARYRQLARLSDQLAEIASGNYTVDIRRYSEGELSILASEILKLTSTLSHQADSLRREGRFLADSLADISHQLKTPLTSVSMMADLLETPELPPEKREEFLAGIHLGIDRVQWLVASLLKLSRLDAGAVEFRAETVSLAQVLEKAAAPLRIPMELREQTLELSADPGLTVEADGWWLAEALGNLLKNCTEHTGPGGVIRAECARNALYTEIRILDDGPGFAPEDLPHIFERFFRGKNAAADSVGIGLALSKSIIQNQAGVLSAENRPSGGALFTVKLYGRTVV